MIIVSPVSEDHVVNQLLNGSKIMKEHPSQTFVVKERAEHRFKTNPLELVYAEKFRKEIKPNLHQILGYKGVPAYDLADRDIAVAGRIIQWLASPAGQNFVKRALGL